MGWKIDQCKDKEKIKILWKKFFYKALARWGYNIKARKDLFEWDIGENMGIVDLSIKYRLSEFKAEVCYICDRLSLCRLFRAHIMFNNIFKR